MILRVLSAKPSLTYREMNMNTGYTIKLTNDGYKVEFFRMNSYTFEVTIIEERGPFKTQEEARDAERAMRDENKKIAKGAYT
jgi:hypothetical protein